MGEPNEISRRKIMRTAIWGIGGLIGSIVGVSAAAYIGGPSIKKPDAETWVRLGSTSKVELGVPTLFAFSVETQTGWITNIEEVSVYVLTTDGRTFTAMANIYTHLGCRVRWISERGEFFCPCHNGVFNREGMVISGPPPRPLDRYDIKVENDQLYVLMGG